MAGFGMQLNAKIAQHQKLSPQMQFRQKILAMGNLELTQQIHQALETNPAIEEVVKTSEVKEKKVKPMNCRIVFYGRKTLLLIQKNQTNI